MISEQAKKALDYCIEHKAVFVTSTDAWLSIGSDERELLEVLKYARDNGVTVTIVPTIVRPESSGS